MLNRRSTWSVLQTPLQFVHLSVMFMVLEGFVCFPHTCHFVKVKATTWKQSDTEAFEMLSINQNFCLPYKSVSAKSHCIYIAACWRRFNVGSLWWVILPYFLMLASTWVAKAYFLYVKVICIQTSCWMLPKEAMFPEETEGQQRKSSLQRS